MLWMICYDITDNRRRHRVEKALLGRGERVQKSIFECHLRTRERKSLEQKLIRLIDSEEDNLRFYRLCEKDRRRIKICGQGERTEDWNYLLI
ncbi:MAG: CRISPR-associated endonuclease Cas2 [gamma proteobacterium endosymbiont of Lamellibrachia anaximandri]|nr:CRISPR-associated endonuclease Cas2 [gamma proteobacterium endosymbiont of Lamellibrachia anaximandri]MBL3535495.1 CRISPR-associated endonuclease Cas2 [gamma proteobacterium endosymbiont of Lamellibrachia anaximandri]